MIIIRENDLRNRLYFGKAKMWLETVYGPGSTIEIIRKLALAFWQHSITANPKERHGRIISGNLLLEWGRLAGIKDIASPSLKQNTHIMPCEKGFKLSIRASSIKRETYYDKLRIGLELDTALRWDYAHEIGHTFFYDKTCDPPRKIYGFEPSEEEAICQQFAAELLMPYDRIIKSISLVNQLTIESLVKYAKTYGIPLRAVIRRLINDIAILRATGIIISKRIAASWSTYRNSKKPLPSTGIEVYLPPHATVDVTEDCLRSHEVINQVCTSGCYWNSDQCSQSCGNTYFVEGMRLSEVAPKKHCLFLFYEKRPVFSEKLLFDI